MKQQPVFPSKPQLDPKRLTAHLDNVGGGRSLVVQHCPQLAAGVRPQRADVLLRAEQCVGLQLQGGGVGQEDLRSPVAAMQAAGMLQWQRGNASYALHAA